jgi:methionyl-tRNA formyltransferase
VPTLRALVAYHDILTVITQPDRPAGRGKQLSPTPVKALASTMGLKICEPVRLRGAFEEEMAMLGADAAVVVSYGRILPPSLVKTGRYGAYNLHPSALPLYRGAMPIAGPIRDGRVDTDVCVILMDDGLDTGDVVVREHASIGPYETGTELHDRLAEIGAQLVLRALERAENGLQTRQSQVGLATSSEIEATFTRPLRSSELMLDWSWPAARIANTVRAYAELPAARAEIAGERIKVLRAAPPSAHAQFPCGAAPGTLLAVHEEAAVVACGDGVVLLERLSPPNRGAQSGAAFARGRLIEPTIS